MSLNLTFIVRDPVHGLMSFTELERDIIDLPVFQRLRGLKQSSLAHLTYPTALTTRFEHSLGVAHIAGRILDHLSRPSRQDVFAKLVARVQSIYAGTVHNDPTRAADQIRQGVRLASLLHDLGHLPFSHCFEKDFEDLLGDPQIARRWGSRGIGKWQAASGTDSTKRSAPTFHEFLGARIAEENQELRAVVRRHSARASREIALDILNPLRSKRAKDETVQKALGKIVHGEIDADRLDFVSRDPLTAGSGLGGFDIDRLIRSLELVHFDDQWELVPSIQGISALESFLAARLSTYRWQYHHYNVIYHDLLLKLVVSRLLKGTTDDEVDLMRAMSYENFTSGNGASRGSQWIFLDDGFILSRLMALRSRLLRKRSRNEDLNRLLVMAEEILFRGKRRVVLWKDHNGYLTFCGVAQEEVAKALARRKGLSVQDGEYSVEKCWNKPKECVEAMMRAVRSKRKNGGLEALQGWLWERDCAWMIVDFRVVEPFRKFGGVKAVSEMKVATRIGDAPSTRTFEELSSVLSGFGDFEGKEVRFFAYELIAQEEKKLSRPQMTKRVNEGRRRLAQAMANWLFDAKGVDGLQQSERKILGV
jgi:HD superfamily phosphohydrolase